MSLHTTRKFVPLLLTLFVAGSVSAADWSNFSASYRYGPDFREPNNRKDVAKSIVQFTYADGYAYGQNFFNMDALFSDSNDKPNSGGGGAQEIYVIYNHKLSMSKTTGTSWAFGPVKDVALFTGFDLNTKNTEMAPRARKLMIGPTFQFAVPKGFIDLNLLYYKEWNHNGLKKAVHHNVNFDSTYRASMTWSLPLPFDSVPLSYEGFINYTGPKGKDGFNKKTRAETQTDMFLMLDAG
ncbi:MAG: hypothetical protein ACRC5A_08430 [Enterobacteriaceae bacterium]